MTIWAKEPSNGYSLAPDTPWILHKTLLLPQYGNKCQIYIWPRKKLIFVKCPGRTKMGKSFNVTAYWLQAFGWKNVKIHWKQFVTLLIEQIQSKHNKNMITACHNNDIIFFLLSRDIRFFKKGHQKRPMGQTRWPSIFSSLGVIWSHKKQTKLEYFVILRILIFQCPGTTHITNFTRMPLLEDGGRRYSIRINLSPKMRGGVITPPSLFHSYQRVFEETFSGNIVQISVKFRTFLCWLYDSHNAYFDQH